MASEDYIYTVVFLTFLLAILIVMLIYLYKKLNRDTDGKYTVHELIFGQDGARQRLQNGVQTLESFLGIRFWPRKREGAEGEDEGEWEEECQEERREDPDIELGRKHGTDSLEDKKEDEEEDSSDDYSSLEGVDLREKAILVMETKEKGEKEEEEGGGGGATSGASGGLLVDLKQFSGSAIWQEEKTEVKGDECDLTAL